MNPIEESNRKTILYLSPVDWRWIKQRPQFLAEHLARHFSVVVLYPWKNNRKDLQKKEVSALPLCPYFMLPSFGGRFAAIGHINAWLGKLQLSLMLKKNQPDYLWISHPMQWPMVPVWFSGRIVYDCMDDYEAIEWNRDKSSIVAGYETEIVKKAVRIFASSMELCRKLNGHYGIDHSKITLLRNGYNGKPTTLQRKAREEDGLLKIGYFGTIGRWFDFDLLLDSLSKFSNVEYHLYGPTEKDIQIPRNNRLIYHGVVPHNQMFEESRQLDALMMPFLLNDIVRSVDPVKLYEYIQMSLPILSIYYPEIERFAPFVHFYNDREDYVQQLKCIVESQKLMYSNRQAEAFLKDNSWQNRADTVISALCKAEGSNP